MRVPHNSFVLVADGRKRLFFRNDGDALAPRLVVIEATEESNPATRDQVSDSPGRASSPVSGGGALTGADAHDVAESRFAADTADLLTTRTLAGERDDLIVIAPAKTLGELRKHYHKEVEKRIVREVGKDVTGHTIDGIERFLIKQD